MIQFVVDFDAIGELAGVVDGLMEAFSSTVYLDAIANAAHDAASREFDLTAAASAHAGNFKHMYEFGVNGITEGQARLADPISPTARLWTHDMDGAGGMYDIRFNFRPAVQRNPRPSTANTGIPSKYIKFISRRKYVFYNKAMVMETGQEVVIRPKRGSMLLIPFYGDPGPRGRGYMMWNADRLGPIVSTPGRNVAGSFTSFWEGWWKGTGTTTMSEHISASISADTKIAIEAAAARSAKMGPTTPLAANAKLMAANVKSAAETKAIATDNAIARRGTKRR